MIRRTCSFACLGMAWMLMGASSLSLRAQEEEKLAAEPQAEDPLANSPAAILLRTTHRFEKAFLVRACQLSEEQKREVEKFDDSWKEAIPKQADADPQLRAGGRIFLQEALRGVGNVVRRAPVKTSILEDAIHKYRSSLRAKFSKILTPVQRDVYKQELAARDEFKRQVDAELLVSALDNVLGLESEQRESLTKALVQWPDKDNLYTSYYLLNEGILPVIPDSLLNQHLNIEQLSIYRQARKAEARINQVAADPQQEPFGE